MLRLTGLLNFCLLQWFCLRLGVARPVRYGRSDGGWVLLYWVVPLTGWSFAGDYRYLGRRRCRVLRRGRRMKG